LEQDKAQKQSAYLPGVDKTTIADWEADRTVPQSDERRFGKVDEIETAMFARDGSLGPIPVRTEPNLFYRSRH
jgi:hypothetical protein